MHPERRAAIEQLYLAAVSSDDPATSGKCCKAMLKQAASVKATLCGWPSVLERELMPSADGIVGLPQLVDFVNWMSTERNPPAADFLVQHLHECVVSLTQPFDVESVTEVELTVRLSVDCGRTLNLREAKSNSWWRYTLRLATRQVEV